MPEPTHDETQGEAEVQVRLLWPVGTGGQSVYANQFALTRSGPDEYVLEFGEFLPTGLAHRTKEEIEEQLKDVLIKPVARIILSRRGFEALTGMLNKQLKKLLNSPEKLTSDD